MFTIRDFDKAIDSLNYQKAKLIGRILLNRPSYPESIKLYIEQKIIKSYVNVNNSGKDPFPNFMGKIEQYTDGFLTGWIINTRRYITRASGLLLINQEPYMIINTNQERSDINDNFKKKGYWGFCIPINFFEFSQHAIRLVLTSPYNPGEYITTFNVANVHMPITLQALSLTVEKSIQEIKALKQHNYYSIDRPSFISLLPEQNTLFSDSKCAVSLIMLNLNGSKILKKTLLSILKLMSSKDQLIIIDHASTDNSQDVISQFNDKRIQCIKRDRNYSFSESNNFAIQFAKNDFLIFINNDIILSNNNFTDLIYPLVTNQAEIVGASLVDIPVDLPDNYEINQIPICIQHSGIRILSIDNNYIVGEDIRGNSFEKSNKKYLYRKVPATTSALFAVTKKFFIKIKGFNEAFYYGQEDIHFCLNALINYSARILVSTNFKAYHLHGFTRLNFRGKHCVNKNILDNNLKILNQILFKQMSSYKHRLPFESLPLLRSSTNINIYFLVSDLTLLTKRADIFTAYELATAIENSYHNVRCFFIKSNTQTDLRYCDVLVNMLHNSTLSCLHNLSPSSLKIAWMRNWFDKWAFSNDIDSYNILYSSSKLAIKLLEKLLFKQVHYLPVAASKDSIAASSLQQRSDKKTVSFIGSYFKSPRRIADWLNLNEIDINFELYGYGWESHDLFSRYTKGPIEYNEVIKKYKSSSLVLDDANIATDPWGSVNCRVFDALAAGCPVITNGLLGSQDVFNGLLPVYFDQKSLTHEIKTVLSGNRNNLFKNLQKLVLYKHTYSNRAETIMQDIYYYSAQHKVSICTAIPSFNENPFAWGDLYLARKLRHELENLSLFIIICDINNYLLNALNSSYNICLRGLHQFDSLILSNSLLWIISHPKLVSIEEISMCDKLAIASNTFLNSLLPLRNLYLKTADYIPQFSTINPLITRSEINILYNDSCFNLTQLLDSQQMKSLDFIFVGNTRGVFRDSVRYAIENGFEVKIIGSGWERFVDKSLILAENVPNSILTHIYCSAKVVLCDHWEDMREVGFISNRVYDLINLDVVFLIDNVLGIEIITQSYKKCFVYHDSLSFKQKAIEALDYYDKESLNFLNKTSDEKQCSSTYDQSGLKRLVEIINSKIFFS
ncbi:glycosyltransferase [Synechococcus sp. M16CYN]|uniref:glycosyltransferase family protein n=1 Tax=Synechococcus sp. M16CYN TaxID=3103139 RepID=UPI0030E3F67D